MPGRVGKPDGRHANAVRRAAARPRLCRRAGRCLRIAGGLMALAGAGGCSTGPASRAISLAALERAPATRPTATQRCIVADPAQLGPLCQPLGRRLGLIQIRDRHGWEHLTRAARLAGSCPDFRRGIIVGLVSQSGTALDGAWPFRWDALRACNGAGLIEAHFVGGNYLADDTTYLEAAYVEELSAVLVVTVDGMRYYPLQHDAGEGHPAR